MQSLVLAAEGEGFQAPGPAEFELPPVLENVAFVTKPFLLAVLAAMLVAGFFMASSRRAAVVPSKLQFAGEQAYGFVRNTLARDVIGSEHFMRFVPYLVTLFFFLLVNNVFGLVPVIQFPTMSRVGYAYALAFLTWVIFNAVGIARHGFLGYLKHASVPPGVPRPVYIILIPIEFVSNIIVRPATLSLRLFANMFAGHLLLLVFVLGGEYLLVHGESLGLKAVGILSFVMAIALSFLELLVQVLQAFIFTILTALYISGALAEEH
jgi:F-type H+-transporting ATPase subunit a